MSRDFAIKKNFFSREKNKRQNAISAYLLRILTIFFYCFKLKVLIVSKVSYILIIRRSPFAKLVCKTGAIKSCCILSHLALYPITNTIKQKSLFSQKRNSEHITIDLISAETSKRYRYLRPILRCRNKYNTSLS